MKFNKKLINFLNSFLSQIVTNARKSFNHVVIIYESLNKNLSESNKEEDYLVHKKFFDWI